MAAAIIHQPATRLAARLAAGELSAVELLQACLARTRAVDGRVQAFNSYDEAAALAAARESDARRAAGRAGCALVHSARREIQILVQFIRFPAAGEGRRSRLADAGRLISAEVLYPTTPQVAAENLYAWSTVVDVFHGVNHEISRAIRAFVLKVGPSS